MKPKIYILSAIIIIGVLFCLCSCAGTMRSEITDAIDTSAVADTDVILDTTVAYDTTGVPDITDALDTTSAPNTTVPKSAVTDSFVTDKVEETSRPAVVTDAPGTWPDPDRRPTLETLESSKSIPPQQKTYFITTIIKKRALSDWSLLSSCFGAVSLEGTSCSKYTSLILTGLADFVMH